MFSQETLNKLKHIKLTGMVEALQQKEADPSYREMGFQPRWLLVDWEYTKRQHNQLQRLISAAKFQDTTAYIEDICFMTIGNWITILFWNWRPATTFRTHVISSV